MSALRYVDHIETLCKAHGITTVPRRSPGGRAWRRERKVSFQPVRSDIAYAIALHEIGHVVGKAGKFRLEKEQLAWDWAKANALEWTPGMTKTMDRCMELYREWAARHKTARTA